MAETATAQNVSNRSTKIGEVVSTKMNKTIVVQVVMKKSHPLYRRVVAKAKKFYAHDENNTARAGAFVEIEETLIWAAGVRRSEDVPLRHYAREVNVHVDPPEKC